MLGLKGLMASFAEHALYLHMRIFSVHVEVFKSHSISGIFLHHNGEFTRALGPKTTQPDSEFGIVSIHSSQTVRCTLVTYCTDVPLKTVIENIDFINSQYLLNVVTLTLANLKKKHTYTHSPSQPRRQGAFPKRPGDEVVA